MIQGLTTFAFAWLLLRYDLRTVPAFVATGLLLDGAASAAIAGTAGAWIMLGADGGRDDRAFVGGDALSCTAIAGGAIA